MCCIMIIGRLLRHMICLHTDHKQQPLSCLKVPELSVQHVQMRLAGMRHLLQNISVGAVNAVSSLVIGVACAPHHMASLKVWHSAVIPLQACYRAKDVLPARESLCMMTLFVRKYWDQLRPEPGCTRT